MEKSADSLSVYNSSLDDLHCLKSEPIEMTDNILWEAGEDQLNEFVVGPTTIELEDEDDFALPPPTSAEFRSDCDNISFLTKTRRVPFVYRPDSEFVIKTEPVDDAALTHHCLICKDGAEYAGSRDFWKHVEQVHAMTPERYVHTYPDYRIADSDSDIDGAPFDLTVAAVDAREEAELLGSVQPSETKSDKGLTGKGLPEETSKGNQGADSPIECGKGEKRKNCSEELDNDISHQVEKSPQSKKTWRR